MKPWFQFSLNKVELEGMRFLYLRVGPTAKIFEDLKLISDDKLITWDLEEVDNFSAYHFGPSIKEYDGIVINMDINDDDLHEFRRDFWENYVWKTENLNLVTALVIPNTDKPGSLTKPEIIEALSLIRLTDRPFDLFEVEDNLSSKLVDWLTKMAAFVHRKLISEQESIKQ